MAAIETTEELAVKARRIRRHIIAIVTAAEAADTLPQEGIDCRLLNMATLRPMGDVAIVREVKAAVERKGS